MKKEFIYNVAGNEYRDTEAFGQAWKAAKAKAIEVHAAIYRTVKKGETVSNEVFYKSGCFNSIEFATNENIMIY